jgi:hypothetical protein
MWKSPIFAVVVASAKSQRDHQFEPARNRIAFDGGDGGLFHVEEVVIGLGRLLREIERTHGGLQMRADQLAKISARAEGVATAAEHHRAHAFVGFGLAGEFAQQVQHARADAVLHLGPVDPDRGDRALYFVFDDIPVCHGKSPWSGADARL